MKRSRFLLIIMMVVPWFSFPLLGRKTVRRFLPAAIFITIVSKLINVIARKQRWWGFYTSIHPSIKGDIPFNIGPFFITSLWILKWTYGKFPLFAITNAIIHFLFSYPGLTLLNRLGIATLLRFSRFQLFLLYTLRSWLLYGFQYLYEVKR